MNKKKHEFPHAFVILFAILVLMVICTWLVPAGQYNRVEVDGKQVVDADSFQYVESSPVGFMGLFQSIPQGIQDGAALITMIFTIGAAIGLVNSTGALKAAVMTLSKKLGEKHSKLVLIGIMVFFLFIGGFPAMLEGTIPFAAVCIPICLALGYDVITGISVVFIADIVGWSAGPANYYTVGNAQIIGGLKLFSGFSYRMVALVVLGLVSIFYVIRYAEKVRKDPSKGLMAGQDYSDLAGDQEETAFTGRRKLVVVVFMAATLLIVIGCLKWGWGMPEMSAVYIICGIVCGIIAGYKSGKIADELLEGAKSVFIAAMAIGMARAISVVMQQGLILDTIIHGLSGVLAGLPESLTSIGMLVVQTILNFFIPSGSSQALVTMPVLMPVAEITGLSKQLTILAFQFGDGLSNLCYPTMGALIAFLSYGRVPFNKWIKFIMPFMLLAWGACIILLIAGTIIGY